MIFVPNESKKIVNIFLNNDFKESKSENRTFYTLNNKFLLETPEKTIVFGKTNLVLEKNIFKNLQGIAEIKDTEFKCKSDAKKAIFDMKDNVTNIKFAFVTSHEKTANVGHVKINGVFKGTYVWCQKHDTKYFTNFLLPHAKNHKIYKSNSYEEFLHDLIKDNM